MHYHGIGIVVAVVLVAALWSVRAADRPRTDVDNRRDDALVKRGEYLVNEVAGCTHCHTPQRKGEPDRSRALQGATLSIRPKEPTKEWADKAPDLTRSGMAGMWSEADLVKFLTKGVNPEGGKPVPPMPTFHLHEEDARAVAAYLRTLPGKKSARRER